MYRYIKRLLDVVVSFFLILLFLPFMILIALIVFLSRRTNPIFKQERVGRNNNPFTIYKIRTTGKDYPEKISSDERREFPMNTNAFEKILRKTSLDEIPQFWNVIKGDMSLIGPRPLIAEEGEVIVQREKLGINTLYPGVSGYAQIKGRENVTRKRKVELDYYYYKNHSFSMDVYCLLATVPYIVGEIFGRGLDEE